MNAIKITKMAYCHKHRDWISLIVCSHCKSFDSIQEIGGWINCKYIPKKGEKANETTRQGD